MLNDLTGNVHFVASILSLLFGTYVLAGRKGSPVHVRAGYAYAASMLVVLVTSFMIYKLHGSFGVLHGFAVVSSATLLAGLLPMWLRRPADYFGYHVSFMYWSVIGLYCAFFAETFTRLPFLLGVEKNILPIFYALVGLSTGVTAFIGGRFFQQYKDGWLRDTAGTAPAAPETP